VGSEFERSADFDTLARRFAGAELARLTRCRSFADTGQQRPGI
jgi:hypothetical protein